MSFQVSKLHLSSPLYIHNNVLTDPRARHLAWKHPQHASQRPEGQGPCRKTCSKPKLLGIGKRKAKSKRIHMDLTLTTGTSLRKKGKLEHTWWNGNSLTIGAHLLKAPESQSLSQGKMSLLGYTFCINLASVETLTRV